MKMGHVLRASAAHPYQKTLNSGKLPTPGQILDVFVTKRSHIYLLLSW